MSPWLPNDTFVKEPPPKPNRLLVFPYRSDREQSDIELRYTELFRHLEYGIVSREMPHNIPRNYTLADLKHNRETTRLLGL
jgi:hypothetical protein